MNKFIFFLFFISINNYSLSQLEYKDSLLLNYNLSKADSLLEIGQFIEASTYYWYAFAHLNRLSQNIVLEKELRAELINLKDQTYDKIKLSDSLNKYGISDTIKFQYTIQRGDNFLSNNQAKYAVIEYKKALEIFPNDTSVNMKLKSILCNDPILDTIYLIPASESYLIIDENYHFVNYYTSPGLNIFHSCDTSGFTGNIFKKEIDYNEMKIILTKVNYIEGIESGIKVYNYDISASIDTVSYETLENLMYNEPITSYYYLFDLFINETDTSNVIIQKYGEDSSVYLHQYITNGEILYTETTFIDNKGDTTFYEFSSGISNFKIDYLDGERIGIYILYIDSLGFLHESLYDHKNVLVYNATYQENTFVKYEYYYYFNSFEFTLTYYTVRNHIIFDFVNSELRFLLKNKLVTEKEFRRYLRDEQATFDLYFFPFDEEKGIYYPIVYIVDDCFDANNSKHIERLKKRLSI